jgi:UPF0122 protein CLOM621_08127
MDNILEQDLLFDFYGELLSEKQKKIYSEVVFYDYSISEVAKDEGISRQSVSDMIKRCDKTLLSYEEKLGLVKKFLKTKALVYEIKKLGKQCMEEKNLDLILKIDEISDNILDFL